MAIEVLDAMTYANLHANLVLMMKVTAIHALTDISKDKTIIAHANVLLTVKPVYLI
jgi:hypothetical protein